MAVSRSDKLLRRGQPTIFTSDSQPSRFKYFRFGRDNGGISRNNGFDERFTHFRLRGHLLLTFINSLLDKSSTSM
uniref:Uncharacterized protein n=1 Tax=Parascaris equorum TaxID=6256 RepID=A0A914RDC5_PAREQ